MTFAQTNEIAVSPKSYPIEEVSTGANWQLMINVPFLVKADSETAGEFVTRCDRDFRLLVGTTLDDVIVYRAVGLPKEALRTALLPVKVFVDHLAGFARGFVSTTADCNKTVVEDLVAAFHRNCVGNLPQKYRNNQLEFNIASARNLTEKSRSSVVASLKQKSPTKSHAGLYAGRGILKADPIKIVPRTIEPPLFCEAPAQSLLYSGKS